MDGVPDSFSEWSFAAIAAAQGMGMLWAFLTGRIVPRSLLDTQIEATKRAQEANDKILDGLREQREMGRTTIALIESIKTTGRKGR